MTIPHNEESSAYPTGLERELRLDNDAVVRTRPIRPDDAPGLMALHERLSDETRRLRFFAAARHLASDSAARLARVDYQRRFAIVAEAIENGAPAIVGVARYEATGPDVAEGAVVVQDSWQGHGLGTTLLRQLFAVAATRGIHRFRSFMLHDNARLIRTLQTLGRIVHSQSDGGIVELDFIPSDAVSERVEREIG